MASACPGGIDLFFDTLGGEIRNLLYDAEASRSYFLCETMGRSAGWLSYGAAIAGEASLVISVEDIHGKYRDEESVVDADGTTCVKPVMNIEEVVRRIVKTMLVREEKEGKQENDKNKSATAMIFWSTKPMVRTFHKKKMMRL